MRMLGDANAVCLEAELEERGVRVKL